VIVIIAGGKIAIIAATKNANILTPDLATIIGQA
jgi:hypothetical protein